MGRDTSSQAARALARIPGHIGGLLLVANLLFGLFAWSYFSPPFSLPVSGALAFILAFFLDLYRRSLGAAKADFEQDRSNADRGRLAQRTLRRLMFHRSSRNQLSTMIVMIVIAGAILTYFFRRLSSVGLVPQPQAFGVLAGVVVYVVVAAFFAWNRRTAGSGSSS